MTTNDRATLSDAFATELNAAYAAYAAGSAFATELNATPHDAQNWSLLQRGDDLPTEDYITLTREYGDVTPEMEEQYRNGFNAEFDMSLSLTREG